VLREHEVTLDGLVWYIEYTTGQCSYSLGPLFGETAVPNATRHPCIKG